MSSCENPQFPRKPVHVAVSHTLDGRDRGVTHNICDRHSTLLNRQIISIECSSLAQGWLFDRFIHPQLTVKAR